MAAVPLSSPQAPLHIVVMGPGAVGKSSLVQRYLKDDFRTDYDPTIEESYKKQIKMNNEIIFLEIVDTAGQEEFRTVIDEIVRVGKAFLLVYSIDSELSFREINKFKNQIENLSDDDKKFIVLCGNKCDLPKDARKVTEKQGRDLAKMWGDVSFFETSAKERTNVGDAFEECVKLIKKDHDEQYHISPTQETKGGGCCCTIM